MSSDTDDNGPGARDNGGTFRPALAVAYMALVAVLSLLPSGALPEAPGGFHADKMGHVVLYAGMGALCLHATRTPRSVLPALAAGALCSTYGAILECLQPIVQPGSRVFSFTDMAANTAGAFLGVLLYARLNRIRRDRRSRD